MCGLAGSWAPRGGRDGDELEGIARDMAQLVEARGPDDSGEWVDPEAGIALGHRRLAIIDLSPGGRQPMVSAAGALVIAYNGEIYNFRELRAELESAGVSFRGESDTEVLLEACAAWGIERALGRCIGMFAIALWDRVSRRLHLARDRLGIKPLYWGRIAGGGLVFASQPKCFGAHPDWRPAVDRASFAEYLRHGYVNAPRCIYRDAFQVRPGHMVTLDARGEAREHCYWDAVAVARDGAGSRERPDDVEAVERLDGLLRDAVARRMVADVPLGAFLSGGIDSSTVVALMQSQSGRPVRTFSIGFSEKRFDEATHARAVARHLGTDHTELYVEPDHAIDLVPTLSERFDEPFGDSSQLPTLLVSELARRHVTVALSGDGGDELFAGYNRHAQARTLRRLYTTSPRWARKASAGLLTSLRPRTWDRLSGLAPERLRPRLLGDKLHMLAEVVSLDRFDEVYPRLVSHWALDAELVPGEGPGAGRFEPAEIDAGLDSEVERMQLMDLLGYLPGDILTKVDRASMAFSLEARVPLLDHRVVEHTWSLPADLKIRSGETKWILRQVLERYLPRSLFERPKMGFAVPIDRWLRGPLRDWAADLLDPRSLGDEDLFNVELVRRRWDEHQAGTRNWQYPLWTVLMAQAWRRRWLAPPPPTASGAGPGPGSSSASGFGSSSAPGAG